MVGDVVFVVVVVVVVLLFAFAGTLSVVVLVVVELRMFGLVRPSHMQHAFWPYLLLKLLKPIFLS